MTALLLAGAIACEVAGTMSLRASEGFARRGFVAAMIAGYALAFLFLMAVLDRGVSIGVAYGIWAAAGIALTAVAGRLVFRDPLTGTMVAGVALIAVGVFVIENGAH